MAWIAILDLLRDIIVSLNARSFKLFKNGIYQTLQINLFTYVHALNLMAGAWAIKPITINACHMLIGTIRDAIDNEKTIMNYASACVQERAHVEIKDFARSGGGQKHSPTCDRAMVERSMAFILKARVLKQVRVTRRDDFLLLHSQSLRRFEKQLSKTLVLQNQAVQSNINIDQHFINSSLDGEAKYLNSMLPPFQMLVEEYAKNYFNTNDDWEEEKEEDDGAMETEGPQETTTTRVFDVASSCFDKAKSQSIPMINLAIMSAQTGRLKPILRLGNFDTSTAGQISDATFSIYSRAEVEGPDRGALRVQITFESALGSKIYHRFQFLWKFSDVISIRSWAYLPIRVAKLGGKGHEVAIYRIVLRARPDVATSQQILANQGRGKGVRAAVVNLLLEPEIAANPLSFHFGPHLCNILQVLDEGDVHVVQFAMKKNSVAVDGNLRLQQLFHAQATEPQDSAVVAPAPAMNHILVDRFVKTVVDNLDYRHDDDGEFAGIVPFLAGKMVEVQDASADPAENRDEADLAEFLHKEAEAVEGQGGEGGGLANISTCVGNPMSKGVNPEVVLSRAEQTLELISTVRLVCRLCTQEQQELLLQTRCTACREVIYFTTQGGCSHGSTCSAISKQEMKEKGLCPPDASAEGGPGLAGRYGKLPPNDWSSATEEDRLWWNMASCDDCGKLRRFPPHFEQFFPSDKEYEFCCDWNVWDNFNSCEAPVEDGCEADDPDEVTYSAADLARIQKARDEAERGAQPKAKKAKKTAAASDAPEVPKKRGRGRPRLSDKDTVAIEDEDEEGRGGPPQRKKVDEGGVGEQSVHGMSMRSSRKEPGP